MILLWAHTHTTINQCGFITTFQQFHQGSSALSRCPLWCFQSQRLMRRTWCACGFALALGGLTSNVAQNLDLLKGPSESKLSMVVNIMWIHFAMAATVWCTKTYVSVSGTKLGVATRCPTPRPFDRQVLFLASTTAPLDHTRYTRLQPETEPKKLNRPIPNYLRCWSFTPQHCNILYHCNLSCNILQLCLPRHQWFSPHLCLSSSALSSPCAPPPWGACPPRAADPRRALGLSPPWASGPGAGHGRGEGRDRPAARRLQSLGHAPVVRMGWWDGNVIFFRIFKVMVPTCPHVFWNLDLFKPCSVPAGGGKPNKHLQVPSLNRLDHVGSHSLDFPWTSTAPSVTRWKAAAVPPLSLAPSSQGAGEMPSGNIGVVSGDLQVTCGLM